MVRIRIGYPRLRSLSTYIRAAPHAGISGISDSMVIILQLIMNCVESFLFERIKFELKIRNIGGKALIFGSRVC